MRHSPPPLLATAALIGSLVIVGCGSSSGSSHPDAAQTTVTVTRTVTGTTTTTTTQTQPKTTTSATTTGSSAAVACSAANLTPSLLGSNGAAGTLVLGLAVENSGNAPCHTYGWPGVEFLSSKGVGLPTNASRTTSDVVGSTPATALTLKPGQTASFRIVASDVGSGGGSCPIATGLQIYAPDDTVTMRVAVPGVAACGRATVSPMMRGTSAFSGQGGGGPAAGSSTGSGGQGVSSSGA